jgi:RNA recognition motif-containing protein
MKDDFAFIEFNNIQSATKALLEMNGAKLCNSKIMVEEAKPREGEILPRSN